MAWRRRRRRPLCNRDRIGSTGGAFGLFAARRLQLGQTSHDALLSLPSLPPPERRARSSSVKGCANSARLTQPAVRVSRVPLSFLPRPLVTYGRSARDSHRGECPRAFANAKRAANVTPAVGSPPGMRRCECSIEGIYKLTHSLGRGREERSRAEEVARAGRAATARK